MTVMDHHLSDAYPGGQCQYENAFCQIYVLTNPPGIFQYYQTLPQQKEELRTSVRAVLSLSRRLHEASGPLFYCVEVADGQLLPSEDITWIQQDLIPYLSRAGIRYIAYVSPNNLFSNFQLENLLGNEVKLTLGVFQKKADARQWLLQRPYER